MSPAVGGARAVIGSNEGQGPRPAQRFNPVVLDASGGTASYQANSWDWVTAQGTPQTDSWTVTLPASPNLGDQVMVTNSLDVGATVQVNSGTNHVIQVNTKYTDTAAQTQTSFVTSGTNWGFPQTFLLTFFGTMGTTSTVPIWVITSLQGGDINSTGTGFGLAQDHLGIVNFSGGFYLDGDQGSAVNTSGNYTTTFNDTRIRKLTGSAATFTLHSNAAGAGGIGPNNNAGQVIFIMNYSAVPITLTSDHASIAGNGPSIIPPRTFTTVHFDGANWYVGCLGSLATGSATAGSAAAASRILTPAFVSGTSAQLANTDQDYMVYLECTTACTSLTLAIGPTSGVTTTLMSGQALAAGSLLTVRLPNGWFLEWTDATGAFANQKAVPC